MRPGRRARITERALEYTEHDWPVAALAVPWGPRCPCGASCADPHVVSGVVTTPANAAEVWVPGHEWDVALVTSWFDVVDLPAKYGAMLNHKLITTCPTATVPRGRRWHFVVGAGSFPADLVAAAGGTIHSGPDDWIAASPTCTEATGRIGWVVPPLLTRWQPFHRADLVDVVFATVSRGQTMRRPDR